MKKITIKEFAEQAMKLAPGATIGFSVTNEEFTTLEYFISLIRVADSCCLLANCVGGGHPLVIDVTIYDESLINICDTLDKYINGSSGNYGYVDVIRSGHDCKDTDGKAPSESSGQMRMMNEVINPSDARHSLHMDKRQLEDAAQKYLSALFGREITACYDRWEYYHWGFNIADTPLSKEEIEKLFLAAGADDFDLDSNDFGEYPIMELGQGLAEKMLAEELPFIIVASHADNEGVWFFSPREAEQVNILVHYPESGEEPDIYRFSLKEGVSENDLTNCFWDTLEAVEDETADCKQDSDRLSKLDTVIERVAEKTGCKASGLSITFSASIV